MPHMIAAAGPPMELSATATVPGYYIVISKGGGGCWQNQDSALGCVDCSRNVRS